MAYGARAGGYRKSWGSKLAKGGKENTTRAIMYAAIKQNNAAANNPHSVMLVDQPNPRHIRIEWPTRVLSINRLLSSEVADVQPLYRSSMRKAARTAGLHAFTMLGFKPAKYHSSHQHYTWLMDRLQTVGSVRLFDTSDGTPDKSFDDGNLVGAFKSACDGGYDALVGFSLSKLGRPTWLGHFADAKIDASWSSVRQTNPIYRYGQHTDSSNQIASDRRAMQIIYEFSEDVVAQ